MWFLWLFGNNVEDSMGHGRCAVFSVLCGVAAAAVQVATSPPSALPMLGASGAIGGVMGAYMLLSPRVHVPMRSLLGFFSTTVAVPAGVLLGDWLLLQLLSGVGTLGDQDGGVAFWAHVGGFVADALLLLGLRDRRVLERHPYHGWQQRHAPTRRWHQSGRETPPPSLDAVTALTARAPRTRRMPQAGVPRPRQAQKAPDMPEAFTSRRRRLRGLFSCARSHLLSGPRRTPGLACLSMIGLALVAAAPADHAGAQTAGDRGSGPPAACTPLATRHPNVPDQRPAFPGQTRACAITSPVAFEVVVLATGLNKPWAVEPLPGGDLLVTEQPGRLRLVSATGELGPPITGVPAVEARGQGGLLDVALSPAFDADRTIYWRYAEPRQGGNGTSIARGVLSADRQRLAQVRGLLRTLPTYDGTKHFGARLVFGPDGMLYITLGERSDTPMRSHAQRLDTHLGKILRLTPAGTVPADNPFVGQADARPEIWTLGHRNIQAAAFDPQGRVWVVEHGAQGGDELHRIVKGKNYGWPLVAYGEEYSGRPIPGAVTARPGFEPPVYYWDPVIAPSGAQFYTGTAFPAWRGSLFTGSLKDKRLVRLTLENDRVTGEEHLLADRGQRVRDVRQGPNGALYVVTDEAHGELWKIAPRR